MAGKILITPYQGSVTVGQDPTIRFQGVSESTDVTLRVTADGILSFEGLAGQLFSIADTMTGTIFSVNDISGIPSIEVLDTGNIKLAQYGGYVGIGTSTPAFPLDVTGTGRFTSIQVPNNVYAASLGTYNYSSADTVINTTGGYGVALRVGNVEKARLHSSGGLSLGNITDPGAGNLSVTGAITSTGNIGVDPLTGSSNATLTLTGRNGGVGTTASIYANFTGDLTLQSLMVNTYNSAAASAGNVSNLVFNLNATTDGRTQFAQIGALSSVVTSGAASGALTFSVRNAGSMQEKMRIDAAGNVSHSITSAAPALTTNKNMTFELTSDTSLRVLVRGSDGVTRSTSFTLS